MKFYKDPTWTEEREYEHRLTIKMILLASVAIGGLFALALFRILNPIRELSNILQ